MPTPPGHGDVGRVDGVKGVQQRYLFRMLRLLGVHVLCGRIGSPFVLVVKL